MKRDEQNMNTSVYHWNIFGGMEEDIIGKKLKKKRLRATS